MSVTTKPQYYTRIRDVFKDDEFGELSEDMYKQVFSLYKNDILKLSVKTRIFKFVAQFCERTIGMNAASGVGMKVSLFINTYPFILDTQEIEQLQSQISEIFSNAMNVQVDYIDLKDLTFVSVAKDYIGVIMYDYVSWVNGNEAQWRSGARPIECPIFVPRLAATELPQEALKEFERVEIDPFDYTQKVLTNSLNLTFLPVSFFCVDLPSNPQELTELMRMPVPI